MSSLGNTANLSSGSQKKRVSRYTLMSRAQRVLSAGGILNASQTAQHRTISCHAYRQHGADGVRLTVTKASSGERSAKFSQAQTCGNVWTCAVCSHNISLRRADEVETALQWARSSGFVPLMATYTARHNVSVALATFQTQFNDALRRLWSGRSAMRLRHELGIAHRITGIEVKYSRESLSSAGAGGAGWHYHSHQIMFISAEALSQRGAEDLESELQSAWLKALRSSGLDALPEIGFSLSAHEFTSSQYLSKLGLQASDRDNLHYELAMSQSKTRGGLTPFELLLRSSTGDMFAQNLFCEYAVAMHGVNQLRWSQGLKKLVGLEDLEDELLADEAPELEPEPELLFDLTLADDLWSAVRAHRAYGALLEVASEARAEEDIFHFLHQLQPAPVRTLADIAQIVDSAKSQYSGARLSSYWSLYSSSQVELRLSALEDRLRSSSEDNERSKLQRWISEGRAHLLALKAIADGYQLS